jgi:NADH:ubiquinone oxidoreductase subunit K
MIISILLFTGVSCLVVKNSFLLYFIALELFVLAINLQFIFSSVRLLEGRGLFVAVILLAIAAIDTAIGLSLLIKYHNITRKISIISMTHLKS